ncbi:MAG: dihydroorotate dehydrogenase electron transfer subunit [Desulfobacterales bacterium]
MKQEIGKVLWNTIECSGYFRMGLAASPAYADARPGQFVMIRFCDRMVPFLRRPFSIHRLIETEEGIGGFEILYKVVGDGTEKLSGCRKGDRLDILGPLGNSFRIPENAGHFFVVAGGIGVAPMYFLTDWLRRKGIELSDCRVFIGGRTKDDLLCTNDFFRSGVHTVQIATDDGSAGNRELVTGPLERALQEKRPDMIYACGPIPMLKAVAEISQKHCLPCQVSVETMMACGMGACLGCAMRKKDDSQKYFHACTDGPVFDAGHLLW